MILFFVGILGLAVGSFLNSIIFRLEKGESVFQGRSHCPHCRHPLSWQDLIPLVSFFLLAGKCRYCKNSISWQYPLVELATAILFVAIFGSQFLIFNQFSIIKFFNVIYSLAIVSILIIIFVYDLKHYIIPDQIVYTGIALAFFYRIFENWGWGKNWELEIKSLLPAVFFLAIYILSRGRWLGFGDVKLALLMGLFLGWPKIILALFFAVLSGALVGLMLVFLKKKTMKSEIPFGPFLIAGTFFILFWGIYCLDT